MTRLLRPPRGMAVVLAGVVWLLVTAGSAAAQPPPGSPPPGEPGDCGEGCLWPQPQPPPTSAPPPEAPAPSGSGGLGGWLNDWLWGWFTDLVRGAMSWLPAQLGRSILATPELSRIPMIGQVWSTSQHLMLASYGLLITIAGVLVMAYQTVQVRSSIKEILPRLILAFLAANLSLFFGDKMITIANALSQAIMGDDVGADQAARVFTDMLNGTIPEDPDFGLFYILFTAVVLVVMIIAVLLTCVVRVMLAVVLLVSAPLVLMCHALPQTESIAMWWWKALAGVLVVQVAQSITFLAALKLFYIPGGISLF